MDNIQKIRKYIIVTFIGILLTIFICWMKDFSFDMDKTMKYKILSDATFFTSVILIGLGVMLSISNFGLFTSISYTMKRFFSVFSKDLAEKRRNMLSYHEYRSLKLENDVSGAFIYLPGVLFLIISVVFLIMFYL